MLNSGMVPSKAELKRVLKSDNSFIKSSITLRFVIIKFSFTSIYSKNRANFLKFTKKTAKISKKVEIFREDKGLQGRRAATAAKRGG